VKPFANIREITKRSEVEMTMVILKNGRNIRWLDGLRTKLEDGNEMAIFPPVEGG